MVLELPAVANEVPPVADAPPVVVDALALLVETDALVVDAGALAVDMAPVVTDAPMPAVVVPALVLGAVPLPAVAFELSDSAGFEQACGRQVSNPSNPSNETSDTDRSFTVLPAGAWTTIRRSAHGARGQRPEKPLPSRGAISAPVGESPSFSWLIESKP